MMLLRLLSGARCRNPFESETMKKSHVAAIGCFAIALLLYAFGATSETSGGFVFLGGIFELMGWKNVLSPGRSSHKPKSLSKS